MEEQPTSIRLISFPNSIHMGFEEVNDCDASAKAIKRSRMSNKNLITGVRIIDRLIR
jgi:hypothetical protein